MSIAPRPHYTVEQAVEALRDEAARLGSEYGGDLGRPYLTWRRRLDDLMGYGPERDRAHRILLEIYERAGADA